MVDAIIDMYHGNSVDFKKLVKGGVVAVIHKGTEGGDFQDPKYHQRRDAARAAGLLWGSYHFSTGMDVERQAENYLSYVRPSDVELMALDWEASDGPDMTLEQARRFVDIVRHETGRWPCLYGGHLLREALGGREHDDVLANCPLWYARYATSPIGIPSATWSHCTLWQYTDGVSGPEPRETKGVSGADRNRFFGSLEELRQVWPLTRRLEGAQPGQAYAMLSANEMSRKGERPVRTRG